MKRNYDVDNSKILIYVQLVLQKNSDTKFLLIWKNKYLGLCKALDNVPHNILVSKLERHDFDRMTTQWIKNCLGACTQSCGQQPDVQLEARKDYLKRRGSATRKGNSFKLKKVDLAEDAPSL